ncbi:uncharacterized protein LOC135462471 [Liolophura sinensis]|uniref:uncharacterized protein LOC135462471 n=1 Tax=Liolophura sinensis TaxID=3198878 RepID=UPI003158EA9C
MSCESPSVFTDFHINQSEKISSSLQEWPPHVYWRRSKYWLQHLPPVIREDLIKSRHSVDFTSASPCLSRCEQAHPHPTHHHHNYWISHQPVQLREDLIKSDNIPNLPTTGINSSEDSHYELAVTSSREHLSSPGVNQEPTQAGRNSCDACCKLELKLC